MDKLKQFIDTHRDAFDEDIQLPDNFVERFAERLPQKSQRRTFRLWPFVAAVAAGLALLLLLQLPQQQAESSHSSLAAQQAQQEIEEVRLYYHMQMTEVFAQIREHYKQQASVKDEDLLAESQRIIKNSYLFEAEVLPTLIGQEETLFVLNQYYTTNLESLHFMLQQMTQENNV